MLEQPQIRQILADILESPEFKESQRYRELLQFLVEESIAGRSPKETTIGTQIFGKDPSFNSKEDATVRVYINNLGKSSNIIISLLAKLLLTNSLFPLVTTK